MKIATWNVNSIRQRLPLLAEWVQRTAPDVILLQEIKCQEETFPWDFVDELGYNAAVYGQKTFNGVAILSRSPLEDVIKGLPQDSSGPHDPEARYIEAWTKGVRVASIYVPNGQSLDSEKFLYKKRFLQRLHGHLSASLSQEEPFVVGGDFNIAPEDRDVAHPDKWKNQILCSLEERKAFYALQHLGYRDGFRDRHPQDPGYTWWDYRGQSWERHQGLRIDHLLLSPYASDRVEEAGVDQEMRGYEKTSDHAPVWVLLQ